MWILRCSLDTSLSWGVQVNSPENFRSRRWLKPNIKLATMLYIKQEIPAAENKAKHADKLPVVRQYLVLENYKDCMPQRLFQKEVLTQKESRSLYGHEWDPGTAFGNFRAVQWVKQMQMNPLKQQHFLLGLEGQNLSDVVNCMIVAFSLNCLRDMQKK